jgi:hypothetical protein
MNSVPDKVSWEVPNILLRRAVEIIPNSYEKIINKFYPMKNRSFQYYNKNKTTSNIYHLARVQSEKCADEIKLGGCRIHVNARNNSARTLKE